MASSTPRTLRLATRGSALARRQAEVVAALLAAVGRPTELVVVTTTGDRQSGVPVSAMGGQGVFVKEVQVAVAEGRADLAVHSAKDLPAATPPELVLAAIPERGDPRDALVGRSLEDLGPGAEVATGSPRRRAQLARLRPDLRFTELRGNIATRLSRVPPAGAVAVAAAALARLDLGDRVAEVLDPSVLVPQVGQGALAVECRVDDREVREVLAGVDHRPSRVSVEAERAFLAAIGGGCDLPLGAYARPPSGGRVHLEAILASPDGRRLLRRQGAGSEPGALGRELAVALVDLDGGRDLLATGRGEPPITGEGQASTGGRDG
ncbi:MAG TPA: hydroxymethylbilane synthase [Acidimicrobiales bacterium]|nr:hydroxymethylbilane synthase [Acidimicrobiales bacterium]